MSVHFTSFCLSIKYIKLVLTKAIVFVQTKIHLLSESVIAYRPLHDKHANIFGEENLI